MVMVLSTMNALECAVSCIISTRVVVQILHKLIQHQQQIIIISYKVNGRITHHFTTVEADIFLTLMQMLLRLVILCFQGILIHKDGEQTEYQNHFGQSKQRGIFPTTVVFYNRRVHLC